MASHFIDHYAISFDGIQLYVITLKIMQQNEKYTKKFVALVIFH